MDVFLLIVYFILLIIYRFYRYSSRMNRDLMFDFIDTKEERYRQRQIALQRAAIFLSPYNNIWNNLKLGNKYCYAEYKNGKIRCGKKNNNDIYFLVTKTGVHTIDELWDMLCFAYEYNTSYRGLAEFFTRCGCKITESKKSQLFNSKYEKLYNNSNLQNTYSEKKTLADSKPISKVDINNCSEIEMTGLPGINVIMSKRIIKKREEIGGFKKIDDFFLYLHIKPHIERQLRDRICINKMKGSLKVHRNIERRVDL